VTTATRSSREVEGAAQKIVLKTDRNCDYASRIVRSAPENHRNFCRKNPNNPYVRQIIYKLQKLGLNNLNTDSRASQLPENATSALVSFMRLSARFSMAEDAEAPRIRSQTVPRMSEKSR